MRRTFFFPVIACGTALVFGGNLVFALHPPESPAAAPNGKTQSEMPTMVMTWTGVKFEGTWTNGAAAMTGPRLKLVLAEK